MKEVIHLEAVAGGLHASAPEALPFAPSLDIRSFLLPRSQGNLLIYSVSGFDAEAAAVRELGGVWRQYLNHRHEAMFAPQRGAPVVCHEQERASVAEKMRVIGTFTGRHRVDNDFEVIPIPGHTSGATAFLWENDGHRFLFTGDTISLSDGEWTAAVLKSSDRASYIESLELIRELDFNVLVPWASQRGGPFYARTDRVDARRRIDAIVERVRGGGDH